MPKAVASPIVSAPGIELARANGVEHETKKGSPTSAAERIPVREPFSEGGPLTEADYSALASSWITREIADAAMLRRVDAYEGREVLGQKGSRDCAGILIPYYWPGQPRAYTYRLRRDNPDWKQGRDGNPKPDKKYLAPPGYSNRLYLPPGIACANLLDVAMPIAMTEGEKKALALSRLARHDSERPRFAPIAISGVWNWRGVIGKANGPNGERIDLKGPINDLDRVEWKGRKVLVVFDTNVHTDDSVKRARKGIARELATRGAQVELVTLPPDCNVNGIDDLLALWGPDRVLKLFEKAVPGATLEVVLPPQFQSRPEGMFRVTQKGERHSETQLSNYRAAIQANVRLDDGVETNCEFEIEAELMGRRHEFTIPASEFAGMDWPIKQIGPGAITFPNQREYTRTAIQSFSLAAEEHCVYTHTGWRKVDGHWLFLHGAGALGATGAVSEVQVRLPASLGRYDLRLPVEPDACVTAVRASLRLAKIAPLSIGFPLLAATYRAVVGGTDFAIHLAGETGTFKSEIAALHQQHFGAGMDRLHLPGAWSSTGNALETFAFHAKDALLVVDDFAPQGSSADVARYHAAADRVFRAAGNQAGRGRLDSSARLRESKPPRALIFSTGEDIPRGQSVRARLLILELSKGAINSSDLTICQKDAQAGLYAEAMGGFVQWFAGRYEEARTAFDRKVLDYRAIALGNPAHARTPEIVANLQAGFEVFLEFAHDCGAIDVAEQRELTVSCWEALSDAARAQGKHLAATEPTVRALALVRSFLASGRAHLAARNGSEPDCSPESCGWRMDSFGKWSPLGDCTGWVDGDDVYLEPTTLFRLLQLAGRDAGEVLPVSDQTLRKRLNEKGLLASVDHPRGTLTVRRRIAGSSKDVLHLRRSVILPDEPESDDTSKPWLADLSGGVSGSLSGSSRHPTRIGHAESMD